MIIAVVLTILITYIIVSLFGYFSHKALHKPFMGRFYKSHMVHHLEKYPHKDFVSEIYRFAGKDDAFWIFAIISLPILFIPIVLMAFGLPLYLAIISIIEMLQVAFLNDYIHNSYHIKNHYLSRAPFIRHLYFRLQYIHYLHHRNMQRNFGMFDLRLGFNI